MSYIDTPAKRERIQGALNKKLTLDPPLVEDGNLGPLSCDAIIKARAAFSLDHIGEPVVDTDLMRELGLLTIQDPLVVGAAAAKGLDLLALVRLIGLTSTFVKGLKMDSTTVDVKSAWLSSKNWAAGIAILTNIAAIFHIVIPPDLAPTVQAFVTSAAALYILIKNTWFTGSITTASAKKLG